MNVPEAGNVRAGMKESEGYIAKQRVEGPLMSDAYPLSTNGVSNKERRGS